jgi:flagellin
LCFVTAQESTAFIEESKLGTNILSQTVQRNLGRVRQDLSKASERLSSGQRINRASDDAAGLAISMSLDKDRILARTAQRNMSDGISMVSIMASGLKSQKEILFRMAELAELAEQSANGTYSTQQREVLQKEYGSLMDEFDRVADSSEFNGVKLLRNATPQTIQFMAGITGADTSLLQVTAANSHRYAGEYQMSSDFNGDGFSDSFDSGALLGEAGAGRGIIDTSKYTYLGAEVALIGSLGSAITLNFGLFQYEPSNSLFIFGTANRSGTLAAITTLFDSNTTDPNPTSFILSGSVGGESYSLSLDLSDLVLSDNFYRTGKPASVIKQSDVARPSNIGFSNIIGKKQARRALESVTNRIDDLSSIEGQYGAVESRLNVAHNLLATSGENFAAAASRIKDADIANEAAISVRSGILQ